MFSRIKIGCRNSHRNMLDFFMAHQTKSFVYDLKKNRKYDEYVEKLKNDDFTCEDFIPVERFDFVAYNCPVDSSNEKFKNEFVRACKKIDYVITRSLQTSYNVHLTEVELFSNTKTLLLAMVFSFVLEYLLQMNQEIDITLSKKSTDYLLDTLFDRIVSRFFTEKTYSQSGKRSYMKNLLYKVMSKQELEFETVNSWNKIQNICECVIEDDTLIVIFEMPRTVV